jgi:peroxiredoxin Q/BCP
LSDFFREDSTMLSVGDKAPQFTLNDGDGKKVKLSDFKGKKVVLYFYPKDLTPGCTVEACAFRDDIGAIKKLGAVVLGVSADSENTHQKFTAKHELNFPLLADLNHEVCEKYGAWQEKSMYGRKYWGIARITYIIDENGKIAKVFGKVKPAGHSEEVIAAIKSLR